LRPGYSGHTQTPILSQFSRSNQHGGKKRQDDIARYAGIQGRLPLPKAHALVELRIARMQSIRGLLQAESFGVLNCT
jgi:hypothetical protein